MKLLLAELDHLSQWDEGEIMDAMLVEICCYYLVYSQILMMKYPLNEMLIELENRNKVIKYLEIYR
jgi:hypothetical protein